MKKADDIIQVDRLNNTIRLFSQTFWSTNDTKRPEFKQLKRLKMKKWSDQNSIPPIHSCLSFSPVQIMQSLLCLSIYTAVVFYNSVCCRCAPMQQICYFSWRFQNQLFLKLNRFYSYCSGPLGFKTGVWNRSVPFPKNCVSCKRNTYVQWSGVSGTINNLTKINQKTSMRFEQCFCFH